MPLKECLRSMHVLIVFRNVSIDILQCRRLYWKAWVDVRALYIDHLPATTLNKTFSYTIVSGRCVPQSNQNSGVEQMVVPNLYRLHYGAWLKDNVSFIGFDHSPETRNHIKKALDSQLYDIEFASSKVPTFDIDILFKASRRTSHVVSGQIPEETQIYLLIVIPWCDVVRQCY